MDTRVVTVELDARSYDIYIGPGLIYRIADVIPKDPTGRAVFIVADRNVLPLAKIIKDVMPSLGASWAEIYTLEPGEQSKSEAEATKLKSWFLQNGLEKGSLVLAVGGGVAGDLTGYCVSVAKRGVASLIQVPTTLLAQVDSSVGGKNGINVPEGKNLIGTIFQPTGVIADTDSLKTLPGREILAGYAEIAKYGLINDSGFFNWLEKNGQKVCALEKEALIHALETSVRSKALIVQADEREETGTRALLNLGHTFAHALETAAGYDGRLLHGEAVSIGICMAFNLSVRMGLCPQEDYERVEQHFNDIGLPTRAAFVDSLQTTPAKLFEIMKRDKKVSSGKMRFVLVSGIGQAFLSSDVKEEMVLEVLKESLAAPEMGRV